jgi:hypothetical protein
MAFPWQLALSAMERATHTIALGSQVRLDEASHHLQWSGAASDQAPLDCLTLSMVMGEVEQEGADTCTVGFDLVAFPAHSFSVSMESAAVPASFSVERSSPPLAQRLCLRC